MDWNQELLNSAIWLAKAFALSLVGLTIVVLWLAKATQWGRQVKRIAWPYFDPRKNWRPMAVLALLVLLTLFSVRMNVLLSFWYNGLYAAMQRLDADAFWFMMAVFGVLATIHVARALFDFYVYQGLLIRWREALTHTLMERWLAHQTYHRSQYLAEQVDNPDQRIQEDIEQFASRTLALSLGMLNAIVSLVEFTIILWGLSGALALFGVEIPRGMIFVVYIYVLVATFIAAWLGRPLIRLNFLNELFNANFRYGLIRLREYAESIAFFRGERVERVGLFGRFANVVQNMWDMLFRALKLQGFNLGVSQVAVVFPMILQAPRLFSKEITLGDFMQTAEAFGQVQTALSFFRTSYDDFANYRAVLTRLSSFMDTLEHTEALPALAAHGEGDRVAVRGLSVRTPAQQVLLNGLDLTLEPGDSLLIRGASGSGKTTLLRTMAGLWPFADGEVVRPQGERALFLPQKPYLPLGTLRTALYYPATAPAVSGGEDAAAEALRRVQLGHLVAQLDEEADWTRILSLGEQQRLAIGRALLANPAVLFLDESSSAMDEGLEHAMYALLREALPQATLVSVGHRSTLRGFHERELVLEGGGAWRIDQPASA
ncbi:MAG: ABC transporter ATP-binding protein/permease [Moraxellaceae bacterium]|nr:ABC transporter ATP-binding protein/permease [Moraxellaceae bacterium]